MFVHGNKFNIKNERRIRWDDATCAAFAVSQIGRDDELGFAERKFDWFAEDGGEVISKPYL